MTMMREELIQRLKDLDEEASLLFDYAERLHLIIVGGGALVLMEVISRGTHDVDVINASKKLQGIMEKYDINTRVQTYVSNFPMNYEDRVKPIDFQGRLIDFYTASLEDIVIAKLYAYRDTDLGDITAPEVINNLNWELLHHLATAEDEAQSSALNKMRYREFLANFEDYERRYRPCKD